jgi:hypothetical protein
MDGFTLFHLLVYHPFFHPIIINNTPQHQTLNPTKQASADRVSGGGGGGTTAALFVPVDKRIPKVREGVGVYWYIWLVGWVDGWLVGYFEYLFAYSVGWLVGLFNLFNLFIYFPQHTSNKTLSFAHSPPLLPSHNPLTPNEPHTGAHPNPATRGAGRKTPPSGRGRLAGLEPLSRGALCQDAGGRGG